MNEKFGGFLKTARRMTRNPLGIIGLFIALVYGIAGLVLSFSAQHLAESERLALVCFLVVFPFAILAAFFRLVTHHHWKLYAPFDFPDKDGFYRTMTPDEQRRRLEADVKEIQQDETPSLSDTKDEGAEDEKGRTDVPREISIRQTYALAEELAIREIETEFGVPVQRNLAVGSSLLDGVATMHGILTAIEVKFVRGREWKRRAREALRRASDLSLPAEMPLLIAFVVESVSSEEVEGFSIEYARTLGLWQTGHTRYMKVYDFDKLKTKYGFRSETD